MEKVSVFDMSGSEPVEIKMYWVDAREAVKNDPERYTLNVPDPADAPVLEADGTVKLDGKGKPVKRT